MVAGCGKYDSRSIVRVVRREGDAKLEGFPRIVLEWEIRSIPWYWEMKYVSPTYCFGRSFNRRCPFEQITLRSRESRLGARIIRVSSMSKPVT